MHFYRASRSGKDTDMDHGPDPREYRYYKAQSLVQALIPTVCVTLLDQVGHFIPLSLSLLKNAGKPYLTGLWRYDQTKRTKRATLDRLWCDIHSIKDLWLLLFLFHLRSCGACVLLPLFVSLTVKTDKEHFLSISYAPNTMLNSLNLLSIWNLITAPIRTNKDTKAQRG